MEIKDRVIVIPLYNVKHTIVILLHLICCQRGRRERDSELFHGGREYTTIRDDAARKDDREEGKKKNGVFPRVLLPPANMVIYIEDTSVRSRKRNCVYDVTVGT